MVLNPGVQRRAQDELDSVLRGSRLPTIENRNSLPYVDAIVKEVLRWVSIVPMGGCFKVCEFCAFLQNVIHTPCYIRLPSCRFRGRKL